MTIYAFASQLSLFVSVIFFVGFACAVAVFVIITRSRARRSRTLIPREKDSLAQNGGNTDISADSETPIAAPYAGPRIFISHSSQDNAFGLRLAADIREALGGDETSVWYDASRGLQGGGLRAGDIWFERIITELTNRPIFLVILSPDALSSNWVQEELRIAWTQKNSASGKVIIPILLQPCEVPVYLATIQFVSFVAPRPYAEAFSELLRSIRTSGPLASQAKQAVIPLGIPFEEAGLPIPQHFVGRTEDLTWTLERLKAGGEGTITALIGLAGIGKTSLAAVAIRQLRREGAFPDGIAVVRCQDVIDPIEVLIRVLTSFDPYHKAPQETTLVDLARRVSYTLKDKSALVVLDNVEPGLPLAEVVQPLQSAGLTLLLTARQTLPTAVVPKAASRVLDLLSASEALELFAWALGREHPDALGVAEHAAAVRIVEALGRHTLAMRLAGAYAADVRRDLATLANDLERDPLETPAGETPRGVALILSRSTATLPEGSRQLFAGLAVFATPEFGRRAALALADGLGQAHPQTSVDLLAQRALVEVSLNATLPESANRERLRLHPLLQAFAKDLFLRWTTAEQDAAQHVVAQYYAEYAEMYQSADAVLAADEGNLKGAQEWAYAHERGALVFGLAHGLRHYWRNRGSWREGLRFLAWGVAAAEALVLTGDHQITLRQQAELNLAYGQLLILTGQPEAGEAAVLRDLEFFRDNQDRQGLGAALSALGEAALWRGQLEAAEKYLQQGLAIYRGLGNYQGEGEDLGHLGQVALFLGQYEAAEGYLLRSRFLHHEVGDKQSENAALIVLGQVALARGKFAAAKDYLEQSQVINAEVKDHQAEGVALAGLAQMDLWQGRFALAEQKLQRGLPIFRDVGDRVGEAAILWALGQVALRIGQYKMADDYFQQSLAITHEIGDQQTAGMIASLQGQLEMKRSRYEEAEKLLQHALDIHREIGDKRWEARTLLSLGHVAEALGYLVQAEAWYRSSLTLTIERDLGPEQAEAELALGHLLAIQPDRRKEGCPLLGEAARRFYEMGMPEAEEARHVMEQFGCKEDA